MRLLLDNALTPQIETIRGSVSENSLLALTDNPGTPEGKVLLEIGFEFYVMPRSNEHIVIPYHRIRAMLSDLGSENHSSEFYRIAFWSREGEIRAARRTREHARTGGPVFPIPEPSDSVINTGTEVIISRAAYVKFTALTNFPQEVWDSWDRFKIELFLPFGPDQIPIVITYSDLKKTKSEG
jgi:hypothetical protein